MSPDRIDERIDQVAALGDPARRALYRWVVGQPEAVGREQAARAVGVAHHVAKFHLDRLEAEGLLATEYRRPPGRSGPGAGRPAKLYRAVGELDVSVPERRYDLAGRLLARAVATAAQTGVPVTEALDAVARAAGEEQGRSTPSARRSPVRRAMASLEQCGFEPDREGGEVVLRNCPFHTVADEAREVVCGMNLSFVSGVLDGVGATGSTAVLDPVPGGCCVRLR